MDGGAVERPPVESFPEFYASMQAEPVYLILGVQGSGTNLLGRLLVRTFGFSLIRDRSMIFAAAEALGDRPSARDVHATFDGVFARLLPSTAARKTRKDVIRRSQPFVGIDRAFSLVDVRTGADLARFVYAYAAFTTGTRLMLVKSDDLWEHIGSIDRVLPARRVILLTRDFRDNLVSVSGKRFGPVEPICVALYVKDQFAHYAREFRAQGPAALHVKFEDAVETPQAFLEAFARHFQLSPRTDPAAVAGAFPFRPNKVGKWHRLSERDRRWCEAMLRDELTEFGYALAFEHGELPGQADWAAARARDVIKRVPQKVSAVVARLRS